MGVALWQQLEAVPYPDWLQPLIQSIAPDLSGRYAAQLLWQRGFRAPEAIAGFLDPDRYQPTSPFAFGPEMEWAIQRLQQARMKGERVTIWGDFDADGVTSTSVLWEGLGQFLPQKIQLDYLIPNRLTESHGLNSQGIDAIAAAGTQLIVTCDTGSTNHAEIAYAQTLGIDVIVTDHHTLASERPAAVALINPRAFNNEHPLAHLSGVAVAYKLVEAWYETEPDIPIQPLADLLDLVAIGLIADLVALKGDCRYLAQRGIAKLQTLLQTEARPGVAKLLKLCKREGDRPTDISFGIGPRINAVSRIKGDARFCVELLTSRDSARCEELALETELANNRRKELQRDIKRQVFQRVERLDLATTHVIVLADTQWPVGILGLVAGEVAQSFNRPTILLHLFAPNGDPEHPDAVARGSARSVHGIDLYELVKEQTHLLHGFGGHPFAAGLSLSVQNLPILTQSLNQSLRQKQQSQPLTDPIIIADLSVQVAELGQNLFRELKLLEPYGMGHSSPILLIRNCWFEQVFNRNIKDFKGRKLRYIKTSFQLCDSSCESGFPGIWWEHYQDDIPKGMCDALVELDFNSYHRVYEVRLIDVRPQSSSAVPNATAQNLRIVDWRGSREQAKSEEYLVLDHCPEDWDELGKWGLRSQRLQKPLAIAYEVEFLPSERQVWQDFVGVAKYLARTGTVVARSQLKEKFRLSEQSLALGFSALQANGFMVIEGDGIQIQGQGILGDEEGRSQAIQDFISLVKEEYFLKNYFYHASVETMAAELSALTTRVPSAAML